MNTELICYISVVVGCDADENRAFEGIREPKWEKAAGGWRKIRDVELYHPCFLPDIFSVIRLRWLRWRGCLGASTCERGK